MLTTIVRKNQYADSVALMVLSRSLSDLDVPGGSVEKVSVMMGTPANKEILANTGFGGPEVDAAAPGDMVIGIDASDGPTTEAVVARALELLVQQGGGSGASKLPRVRSLSRALQKMPDANLAVVSIPGEHAAAETHRLLDAGLHVLLFSDNVSVDDEVALKEHAAREGLLVMGPDCGTAAFAGVPLAFANLCAPGSIGVVGASGTGTQEVMVQVDRLSNGSAGISHAIGLGGRDLSDAVGARTCLQALAALDADPATDTIVIVSKPPAPAVRQQVVDAAQRLGKPVVAIFLGEQGVDGRREGNITFATTLAGAARIAIEQCGASGFRADRGGIVGLFTGGTLANEAAMILRDELGLPADDGHHERGIMLHEGPHRVIDLGDDAYTQGRPHPMIDPTSRADLLAETFDDPDTAVVLLDLVIGHGSSPDPAAAIVPGIRDGLTRAEAAGRRVAVVASVCGTSRDPQGLDAQAEALREAGVRVLPDNASAARHAAALARRIGVPRTPGAAPASGRITTLLTEGPRTVNVGLSGFADDLQSIGAPVVQFTWQPPAGGDARLARLVDQLFAR